MISVVSKINKYQCKATNGKFEIMADATKDMGGKNDGFRPHELLEAAFATCLHMSIRMRADKLGLKTSDVKVDVEIDKKHPEKTVFNYKLEINGDLNEEERKKLNKTAQDCPVHKTLSKNILFKKI